MRRGWAGESMRVALTVLVALAASSPDVRAQTATDSVLAGFRAEIVRLAGEEDWWLASNEAYESADGGMEAFGVRYWAEPGGMSAGGCLWSMRGGEPLSVHWRFYMGWDGAAGRPFYHQRGPDGSTGFGAETYRDARMTVMEQAFRWADGGEARQRHRTEWIDEDTHVTESATWAGGRWQPGRNYTWKRMPAAAAPCGPTS